MPPTRESQLERYIARSRRVRRLSLLAGSCLLLLALILHLAAAPLFFTLASILAALAVAGSGAWITWGHLQEFDKELRTLRRGARGARPTPSSRASA